MPWKRSQWACILENFGIGQPVGDVALFAFGLKALQELRAVIGQQVAGRFWGQFAQQLQRISNIASRP